MWLVDRARTLLKRQQKSDPTYGVAMQFFNPGQPIFSEKSYRAFVSEGYRRCGTVYNCINKIAGAAAGIKWKLYTDRTMNREITSHPLLDLWNNPNPRQGRGEFIEQSFGYWHMAGNMYTYANRPNPNEPPVELWTIRPDWMKIVAGQSDIAGYVYGWGTPKARDFDPEEIMHIKFPAYDDDLYGLSPVEVAMYLVDQQNEGQAWNTALMQNAGKPASVFFSKGYLTLEQRTQVRQELLKRYSGKRNAGMPMVLEADMTWQAMSMAPYELDWIQSREMNTRDIAAIFDIAPELVGDSAGKTFANQKEAKQALYTENVLPKLDRYEDHTNMWLVPMFDDLKSMGAYLAYDRKDIEALADLYAAAAKAKSDKATALWNSGQCDLYTAQVMQDGVKPDPNGKGIYKIGAILVRSEDLPVYAQQALQHPSAPPSPTPENAPPSPLALPPPSEPAKSLGLEAFDAIARDILIEKYVSEKYGLSKSDKRFAVLVDSYRQALEERAQKSYDHISVVPVPVESIPPLVSSRASGLLPSARLDSAVHVSSKALDLESVESKQQFAQSIEAQRAKWEEEATKRLSAYFDQERKTVVKVIRAGDHAATVGTNLTSLFAGQQMKLQNIIYQLWQDVGQDVGGQIASSLKIGAGKSRKDSVQDYLDLFGPDILVYLLQLAGQKVTQISTSEQAEIQSALADGVAAGESIPQLAKRIDDLYLLQIIPNRSTVIARTEVVSASNYGSQQAAQKSGLTLKKVWLATSDNRTRPDHAAANGQEVDLDQPFTVGGATLMYPGDPAGPAGEVVNCRCTQFYRRVTAQDDSEEDETNKASRNRRNNYRAFMEATLR